MKLGGLFSGVGGFELAWTQLGHEVAWMCEIDKSARKVLEERFPGVPIYENVEELNPDEVEPVDVLTGGSPCQGFSVAGQRTGLLHGESRLFADYVRIMNGLAERGLKWALWENVPGVLSITNDDGERTFPHVAAALVGADKPLRLGAGRWNTGLADGGGRAVAWRVLDSRYFGVAQRRRRIFACVAFGDSAADRAGRALLAKSEGVSGDSASGGSEGESIAEGVAGGVGDPGGVAHTLTGQGFDASEDGTGRRTPIVPQLIRKVRSSDWVEDTTGSTLAARDYKDTGDVVVQPHAFNWQQGDAEYSLRDDTTALAADSRPGVLVPQAFRKSSRAHGTDADPDATAETWVDDGLANTVNTFDVGDTRTTHAIVEPSIYGVRRLTPVECERLQAFPDGWTEPAGSDSARYKAMGNAVTVNTVRWILGRMLEQS